MSFSIYDYPATREQEAEERRREAELDAEAEELRLSVIEHLDHQHADIVADLDLLGDAEFHPLPGVRRQYAAYVIEEQAAFAALEIVRNAGGAR